MNRDPQQLVAEISARLVRAVRPRKIVLFGSYAAGRATADSDVDLLIVEDRPFDRQHNRRDELQRIRHVLADVRVPKDIILCSADEYARWRSAANHVIARAVREGMVLYEQP